VDPECGDLFSGHARIAAWLPARRPHGTLGKGFGHSNILPAAPQGKPSQMSPSVQQTRPTGATSCGVASPPAGPVACCKPSSRCDGSFARRRDPCSPPANVLQRIRMTRSMQPRFELLCKRAERLSDRRDSRDVGKRLACWRDRRLRSSPSTMGSFEAMRLDELHIVAQEELFEARLALGDHVPLIGDLELSLRSILYGNDCGSSSSSPCIAVAAQQRRFDKRRRFGRSCRRNSGSTLRRCCASSKACPQRGPDAPSAARSRHADR